MLNALKCAFVTMGEAKMKTGLKLIAMLCALALTTQARAESVEGPELGAGLSKIFFDSDPIEDEFGVLIFAGYRYEGPWGFDVNFSRHETETETGTDVKLGHLSLRGLYHFNAGGTIEPYISAGMGRMLLDGADLDDGMLLGAGVGLKAHFAENWMFRPDVFLSDVEDMDDTNVLVSLSFARTFGASGKTKAPKLLDQDKDGVADGRDSCPNTPQGVAVDGFGCPLDSDGDGVADYLDKCPDTAAKLKVDSEGCGIQLSETISIDLKVNFASNSDVVEDQYFVEIKRVSDFMAQYKDTVVVIEGHTDTTGAASYNKDLSQRRADAVAKVLSEEFGIAASRITATGFGEEQPIADESTQAGLLANRRVVAKISTEVNSMQAR
jgi:OOP family OmpA-OmpF porin